MKTRIKRVLGRLNSWLSKNTDGRRILLYHSVGDSPWAIPEANFKKQMELLAEKSSIVSAERLMGEEAGQLSRIAITFDDGYASLHDLVLPILRGVGAHATVFATVKELGTGGARHGSKMALGHYPNESFLTWEDLGRLSDAGWAIGSHGVQHLDLTTQPEGIAQSELRTSKTALENATGLPCMLFAYTWGRHTPRLRKLVADAGYRYAFAGRHGSIGSEADSYAIPRINISNDYNLDDFKAIIAGDWDYLGWIQRLKSQ